MYNVLTVSTAHFYLEAVSLGQLLRIGKASRTHIAEMGRGRGASNCPSPAHSSTSGHVFLMTSPNTVSLSSSNVLAQKAMKMYYLKITPYEANSHVLTQVLQKQMATLSNKNNSYLLTKLLFQNIFTWVVSYYFYTISVREIETKTWSFMQPSAEKSEPCLWACHHLQGISWLIRLHARIIIDPLIGIVLLCKNLLLPFEKIFWGYQIHANRVQSEFGYIIG